MLSKIQSSSLLSTLKRSLEWLLCLGGDASKMSPLAVLPIHKSTVLGDSVVPDNNSLVLPLDACLEVGSQCQMVVQELEKGVGLFLLQANNVTSD